MQTPDESFERLRAAIDELAAGDAAELLAEARADARERVREMLSDALAHSMLDQVRSQLVGADEPAPLAPEPLAPEPLAPEPLAPEPLAPEPLAPEPLVPDPQEAEPSAPAPDELGLYVYGVVRDGELQRGDRIAGIDPTRPVTLVREGRVAAAASEVALAEFGEAQLRAHLADMGWVERTARAHESALEQIQARATVIPMRMCSVYRTEDGVREMLRREASALEVALDHLEGKSEWGVKAFAERSSRRRRSQAVEASDEPGAGAAYMDRKRREREDAERAAQLLDEAAAQIHDRLCAVSAEGRAVPPQRPHVSGRDAEMILNGVYLIAEQAEDAFHDEVEALRAELAGAGIELEATGPWPAYNFVPGTIGAAW
jgi:Gas vesicle synthesis protein GvpL/GvpF